MKPHILFQRDFAAGLMFTALGALVAWGSTDYKLGTTMRMGPGYFPLVLGIAMAMLGLALAVRHLALDHSLTKLNLIEKFSLRSLLLIGGSMLIFGFAVQKAGLIIATIGLVVVSGIAHREFSWKELSVLSIGLATFASIAFVYGLGLPLQVVPA